MKKIEAVFITDSHLDKDNAEIVKDLFSQVIDFCIENKVNNVFHGGDFFNQRTGQSLEALDAMEEIFEMFSNKEISLYGISGNHDKVDLDADKSYLSLYRKKRYNEFVHLFDSPTIINLKQVSVSLLPYYKEKTAYSDKLEELIDYLNTSAEVNSKNILLTHIAIDGVSNNKSIKVKNNIKTSLFEAFKLIFVGHYHNASNLTSKIRYIGSMRPTNFGEDNEKGMTILFEDLSYKQVKLNFLEYRNKYLDYEELSSTTIHELVNEMNSEFCKIKLHIKGKKEDLDKIKLHEYNAAGIEVKQNKILDLKGDSMDDSISFDSASIFSNFKIFCDSNKIKNKKKAVGIRLLSQIR